MDKVYGIHTGSNYEGGGLCDVVFINHTDARKQAKQLVSVEQKEDEMVYGDEIKPIDEKSECPIHEWVELRDDYWTNGLWNIQIQELKVKG